MELDKLKRDLQSVGMTCFVSFFEELSNEQLSTTDLIELISDRNVSESSARTKTTSGRRIIRNGATIDALKIISESKVVDSSISSKAKALLLKENLNSSGCEKALINEPSGTRNTSQIIEKSIWQGKVDYLKLNSKQQENYNMLKLGSAIAEFGFDLIRLNDDWQGADCIANHIDGNTYLKIQLKSRLTIDKKYFEKDLYIAFRNDSNWYLYPHDELIERIQDNFTALTSSSWKNNGHYSWPRLSARLKTLMEPYKLV